MTGLQESNETDWWQKSQSTMYCFFFLHSKCTEKCSSISLIWTIWHFKICLVMPTLSSAEGLCLDLLTSSKLYKRKIRLWLWTLICGLPVVGDVHCHLTPQSDNLIYFPPNKCELLTLPNLSCTDCYWKGFFRCHRANVNLFYKDLTAGQKDTSKDLKLMSLTLGPIFKDWF